MNNLFNTNLVFFNVVFALILMYTFYLLFCSIICIFKGLMFSFVFSKQEICNKVQESFNQLINRWSSFFLIQTLPVKSISWPLLVSKKFLYLSVYLSVCMSVCLFCYWITDFPLLDKQCNNIILNHEPKHSFWP